MAAPLSVAVLAPAKINLTLQIVARRPDGFHELISWVAPLDLCDELSVSIAQESGTALTCDDPDAGPIEQNLVVRAATALGQIAGVEPRLKIQLRKRIPIAAGLGGGSSDAAATLLALNRLWELNWPTERLAEVGAELGSDVPLFVYGAPCVIRGRGERVTPLGRGRTFAAVLVLPNFGVSTAAVYGEMRPGDSQGGQTALTSLMTLKGDELLRSLFNDLERPAFRVEPRLAELHATLERDFARPVRMSGSGSTLFTIFEHDGPARDWKRRVDAGAGGRFHTRICTAWYSVRD